MMDIRLEGLTRRYGSVTALDRLDLDVGGGTVTALLGPSGCGKTTALELMAGLLDPTEGRVLFGGRDVTDVPAERRGAVMVFQDHRLFPYLSAGDNVAFGLRMRGVPRRERRRDAAAALERVGLDGLSDRRPSELSSGQQQRVALARALILQPAVLLLDEPLANLDAHLRDGMRELILDVQRERDLTTVVVTHDQEEAVVLSEDIALLFDGRLHQHGAPRTFFEHPATERTARFFGATNLVAGRRHGERVDTPLGPLTVPDGAAGGQDVWVTIRPERLVVGAPSARDGQHVRGQVVSSAFLGTRTRALVDVAGVRLTVDVADDALADVGPGTLLTLGLPAEALWTVPRDPVAGRSSAPADEVGPVPAGADGIIDATSDPRTRP
jgi:ABC-type Fe3+/spermidine/putrescine transport system ATPase subunit